MISFCEHLVRTGLPDRYIGNRSLDLTLLAGLYAALVVLFMRLVGLGRRLRTARQNMLAAAYGLLLYRRIPQMVIRAEAQLIWNNLKYLLYLGPTLAVGGLVFAGAFDPLHERYGCQPAKAGEDLIVSTQGPGDLQVDEGDFAVEARVRVPKLKATWAKLTAKHAGLLPLRVGSHVLAVNVDTPNVPRVAWRAWDDLTVHVSYPQGTHEWTKWFVGICLVLAGVMMRVGGVQA